MRLVSLVARATTVLVVLGWSVSATAQVSLQTTRLAFDQATGSVQLEDFEEANVSSGTTETIFGPLDSSSSNAVFSPGDIEVGLTIHERPDSTPDNLEVYGDAAHPGLVSKKVGINDCSLDLHIRFSPAVEAVGLDLYNVEDNGELTVLVYSGASLLGSFLVSTAGLHTEQFIGVVGLGQSITEIVVAPNDDLYFAVDDVSFGEAIAAPSMPVLSVWGAVVLAVLAALTGAAALRSDESTRI